MRYEAIQRKLENMLPWLPLLVVSNITQRDVKAVLRWISAGKVRARRVASPYTSTGEMIEVLRDDCLYMIVSQKEQNTTLSLCERGIAPLECEGMTGEQVYTFLRERGSDPMDTRTATSVSVEALSHVHPDVRVVPPVTEADYALSPELLHKRLAAVETALQTLLAAYGGIGKRDHLSDPDIEELMQLSVHLRFGDISLRDCSEWLKVTRQLSQEHLSLINQWGRTHPKDLRCYVEEGYPPYFVVIQATFRVRALLERWPGSDRTGTGLYGLLQQAILEHERLQKITFGQMQYDAFMRLTGAGGVPVGHTATDQYILDFVMKKRIRVGGGQK